MPKLTLFNVSLTEDELTYLEDLVTTYAIDMRLKNSILDSLLRASIAFNSFSPDQEE